MVRLFLRAKLALAAPEGFTTRAGILDSAQSADLRKTGEPPTVRLHPKEAVRTPPHRLRPVPSGRPGSDGERQYETLRSRASIMPAHKDQRALKLGRKLGKEEVGGSVASRLSPTTTAASIPTLPPAMGVVKEAGP